MYGDWRATNSSFVSRLLLPTTPKTRPILRLYLYSSLTESPKEFINDSQAQHSQLSETAQIALEVSKALQIPNTIL